MIKKFNREQVTYGCIRGVLSLILFALTYVFFRSIIEAFIHGFELNVSPLAGVAIAFACVLCVAISGFLRWRNGQDEFTVGESFISNQLDSDNGGAWGTQNYMNRVTGPAFYLTAIFLAAPLQMLKSYEHFQSVLPLDKALEDRMLGLLSQVEQVNKWQNFNTYPGVERELIFLIKMGKVHYSPSKGRIKANL